MKTNTRSIVIMGALTAIELIFLLTPIGTIPIGPLSISLGTIPVALAAVTLGPWGGAAMGALFGLMSFLQCIGIGVPSPMGAALFAIDPVLAFVQRFVPRTLDGLLVGLLFLLFRKLNKPEVGLFVSGFAAAFLNTVLFMSALVLLFQHTEYMQNLMEGKNVLAFIVGYVGINAVVEMIAVTIVVGAVGMALYKAKLLRFPAEAKA